MPKFINELDEALARGNDVLDVFLGDVSTNDFRTQVTQLINNAKDTSAIDDAIEVLQKLKENT